MITKEIKESIRKAFKTNNLFIKTCSLSGKIQFERITDVLRHMTIMKDIYETITIDNRALTSTEDHNLFTLSDNKLFEIKPKDNPESIVVLDNKKIKLESIKEIKKKEKQIYMYDLSVSRNHNFFLTNGILVCNSFAPPSKEGVVAGFTRTRGYRWTDDSLYMHLVQACNYLNLIPPDTSFDLVSVPAPWQPLLLLQAMSYALYDLAILWINEEFTYNLNGYSLDIVRSDKYMSVASTLQSQVDSQMTEAKRRLHYTIGLRQSKYTMSYGGFFGPFTSGRMSIKKWALGFGTSSSKGFGS